jgi:tRNA dimethylallyltransferase
MNIGLIAHNSKKKLMQNFCIAYKGILNKNQLFATGTTGRLVEEVTALQERGYTRGMVSMQGLGYKEIFAYLDGECTLEEAKEIIKRDTRHFAKRQITWFKRERDVIWIDKSIVGRDEDKLITFMLDQLRKKEIIR